MGHHRPANETPFKCSWTDGGPISHAGCEEATCRIKISTLRKPICDMCFVLCRFYFGVLTFYFRVLSFLFMCSVYDDVHFKRRTSRGRDKIYTKILAKNEVVSILMHSLYM